MYAKYKREWTPQGYVSLFNCQMMLGLVYADDHGTHDHCFLGSLVGWELNGGLTSLYTKSSKFRLTMSEDGQESGMDSYMSINK